MTWQKAADTIHHLGNDCNNDNSRRGQNSYIQTGYVAVIDTE